MDIAQLFDIIKIDNYGSITKMSENCYLSRQTVSSRLKSLESELGFEIFQRSKQGVSFTEKGYKVFEFALLVTSEYNNLLKSCNIDVAQLNGSLKIVFSKSAEKYVLLNISSFLKIHPDVNISYRNASNNQIIDCIQNGDADLGILIEPSSDKNIKGLSFNSICDVETYVWMSKLCKLFSQQEIHYSDTMKYNVIVDTERDIDRCKKVFQNYHTAYEICGTHQISNLVAQNKGILFDYKLGNGFQFRENYSEYNQNIVPVKIIDAPKSILGYYIKNDLNLSPELISFTKMLKNQHHII